MESKFKIRTGEEVEGFILGNVLGGRSGLVYEASDKQGNKRAIKIIEGKDNLEQFLKQEDVFKRIIQLPNADNLVKILAYDEDARGFSYIVSPFMVKSNLTTRMSKLSVEKSINIIIQVLNGLSLLHKNEIIHCDIHPGNILFDNNGNARLSDFELAILSEHYSIERIEPGKHYSSDYATYEKLIGCKDYIAPWIRNREKDSSVRSDLYMVTAVLYHLLMKQPRGFSFRDPYPSDKLGTDYKVLDQIIDKGFSPEEATSFESAEQMRNTLLEIQERLIFKKVQAIKTEEKPKSPAELEREKLYQGLNSTYQQLRSLIEGTPYEKKLDVTSAEDVKKILEGQKTLENYISREGLSNDGEALARSNEIRGLIEERLRHDYEIMIKFATPNFKKYEKKPRPPEIMEKATAYSKIVSEWKQSSPGVKEIAVKLDMFKR